MLTLCDPMDCSLPGFSAHGIPQARILEWKWSPFPSPRDLPDPGVESVSSALAGRFFTMEPLGKPHSKHLLCDLNVKGKLVRKPFALL